MWSIRWLVVVLLGLSAFAKLVFPAPSAVMASGLQVLFAGIELVLAAGLVLRPGRPLALLVMLLGLGGWIWAASGRECGCFGELIRIGRSQHLVLGGLLLAAGAHLWISAGRLARPA